MGDDAEAPAAEEAAPAAPPDPELEKKLEEVNALKSELKEKQDALLQLTEEEESIARKIEFEQKVIELSVNWEKQLSEQVEREGAGTAQKARQVELYQDAIESQERRVEIVKEELEWKEEEVMKSQEKFNKQSEKGIRLDLEAEEKRQLLAEGDAKLLELREESKMLQRRVNEKEYAEKNRVAEEAMAKVPVPEARRQWRTFQSFHQAYLETKLACTRQGVKVHGYTVIQLYHYILEREKQDQKIPVEAWKITISRLLQRGVSAEAIANGSPRLLPADHDDVVAVQNHLELMKEKSGHFEG